jgi:hypothetical protein
VPISEKTVGGYLQETAIPCPALRASASGLCLMATVGGHTLEEKIENQGKIEDLIIFLDQSILKEGMF